MSQINTHTQINMLISKFISVEVLGFQFCSQEILYLPIIEESHLVEINAIGCIEW